MNAIKTNKKIKSITENLFTWNRRKNRRVFFWRTNKFNLFQYTIVELLLQKTRAENAEKVIKNFITKYKTPELILKEKRARIKKNINALGLQNQRTKAILRIATAFKNMENKKPSSLDGMFGVGHYISNAVSCFYFNQRVPILDVNTSRVISRIFGIKNNVDLRKNKELFLAAKQILPLRNYKKFNWALLDFGAIVCKPKPNCEECPLKKRCVYFSNNN